MRTTVTIDGDKLSELLAETGANSKASAVSTAISDYLRRKKIESERHKSLKESSVPVFSWGKRGQRELKV